VADLLSRAADDVAPAVGCALSSLLSEHGGSAGAPGSAATEPSVAGSGLHSVHSGQPSSRRWSISSGRGAPQHP